MQRIWQVDFLRGLAIVMMVVFHFAFDLNYLGLATVSLYEGSWLIFQRATISLFLLLVGVSLTLKYEKLKASGKANEVLKEFSKRAAQLFAVALLISIATWLVAPEKFIVFGVIHFIALSTLVAIPFLRFERLNLFLGIIILAAGFFISLPQVNTPLLLWFGLTFPGFQSLDYVPLFPWFGLIPVGIYAGKMISRFKENLVSFTAPAGSNLLASAGRHSLLLYLIHQPVILTALNAYLLLQPK